MDIDKAHELEKAIQGLIETLWSVAGLAATLEMPHVGSMLLEAVDDKIQPALREVRAAISMEAQRRDSER